MSLMSHGQIPSSDQGRTPRRCTPGSSPLSSPRCCRDSSRLSTADGDLTHDFTNVDNVVSANLLACEASAGISGTRVSLNETYSSLQKLTGFSPARFMDRSGLATSTLTRGHIACRNSPLVTNQVNFEEGLKSTVWMVLIATAPVQI